MYTTRRHVKYDRAQSVICYWRRYRRAAATVLQCVASGGLLCFAGSACGRDATGPAPRDIAISYWTLRLNHHAITMALPAPYGVVQLTAAPLTLAGTPVPEAGSAHYSTIDSTVGVDSLGRITARYATLGQPAQVIADLTVRGVTLTDTAFVQVDSFPLTHPLATFSIHPRGTTCRQSAYDAQFTLPVYAIDAAGDTLRNKNVANIPVYYSSSDHSIATIDRNYGNVTAYGPGTVTLTATALVDGVSKQDTLSYTFGPSHQVYITTNVQRSAGSSVPALAFTPSTITVGAGWNVYFRNPTIDTVDVTFTDSIRGVNGTFVGRYANDDTAHTGPIDPGILGEIFFDGGTYGYRSDRFGQSGAIRVQCGYESH